MGASRLPSARALCHLVAGHRSHARMAPRHARRTGWRAAPASRCRRRAHTPASVVGSAAGGPGGAGARIGCRVHGADHLRRDYRRTRRCARSARGPHPARSRSRQGRRCARGRRGSPHRIAGRLAAALRRAACRATKRTSGRLCGRELFPQRTAAASRLARTRAPARPRAAGRPRVRAVLASGRSGADQCGIRCLPGARAGAAESRTPRLVRRSVQGSIQVDNPATAPHKHPIPREGRCQFQPNRSAAFRVPAS